MRPGWRRRLALLIALVTGALLFVLARPVKPETPAERLERLSQEFLDQRRDQHRKPREMWKQ